MSKFLKHKEGKSLERLSRDYPQVRHPNPNTVTRLLNGCETFRQEMKVLLKKTDSFTVRAADFINELYEKGKTISEDVSYTKYELKELSEKIILDDTVDQYVGIYLSALVNKIIKNEGEIVLTSKSELFGLATYQSTGRFVIEGSAGSHTGYKMTGGSVIVTGDSGYKTGELMAGGAIFVFGKILSISERCKGMICQKDKGVLRV